MADTSSYLRFLPPVLWQDEPPPPEFSLGTFLQIFEKLLTGIDDGVAAPESPGEIIARLHRLYDPWATPAAFLPWLAGWVGLKLAPRWDEYQCRASVGRATGMHRTRGLRRGLDAHLALFTVAPERPRVTVDDGARLLVVRPQRGRAVPVDALIAHGPVTRPDRSLVRGGLVRPQCIALSPDRTLLVGDAGTPTYWPTTVKEAVWALPAPGRYAYTGTPPQPQPIGPTPWDPANPGAPVFPRAVAVDNATPWSVYVLDGVLFGGQTALYRLPSPSFAPVTAVATKAQLGLVSPVAMVHDPPGHLLVLDRNPGGAAPKIVDVQLAPFATTDHVLTQVLEPLSLARLANGDLIVGDGREQNLPVPADLVLVNRAAPAWTENRLLAALPPGANPLVAPTGVVETAPGRLLVLDTGLKPVTPLAASPYVREVAEPAALFEVDRGPAPPVITPASEPRSMVAPRGMVFDGTDVVIVDPGEPQVAGVVPPVARAMAHEFTVIVHFSNQRPTTLLERRRVVGAIRELVSNSKPADTHWTLVTAV